MLGKLEAHSAGVDTTLYGLYKMKPNQIDALNFDTQNPASFPSNVSFEPYTSGLGMQGHFAQAVARFGFDDLKHLQMLNALLFSLVFATFVIFAARLTNVTFAALIGVVAKAHRSL